MSRLMVFADEAGDFEFVRKDNVSRYFILATVAMKSTEVCSDLIELRRELAWRKLPLGEYFHCCTDKQSVRDEVFKQICKHEFTIQATIMEKSKAYDNVKATRAKFYKYGWFYHFNHGLPPILAKAPELIVVAASIGNNKERAAFRSSVHDVFRQTTPKTKCCADFCPSAADPGLQIADYCAWAIQRKWESSSKDMRSYKLIADRITYEFDLWSHGNKHHY